VRAAVVVVAGVVVASPVEMVAEVAAKVVAPEGQLLVAQCYCQLRQELR
jgi:hypothetical protein